MMKKVLGIFAIILVVMACGNGGDDKKNDPTDIDAWWVELPGDVPANGDVPVTPKDVQVPDSTIRTDAEDLYVFPEIGDHSLPPADLDSIEPPQDVPKTEEVDEFIPNEGEVGADCLLGTDCVSGLCVMAATGMKCTGPCTMPTDCPAGFACVNYLSNGLQCLPSMVNLCRPCTSNIDCLSNGVDVGDRCVALGAKGNFCGGGCDGGTWCPNGYECHGMTDIQGKPSDQCIKTEGACECSQKFAQEGAWTICYNKNLYGQCEGDRQCTPGGLSQCSAPIPTEELCNAKDDNCNGEVDEGTDDADGDGICNAIDEDADNDNISNFADNCVEVANPGQEDFDKDGKGDACDDDKDGDGDPNDNDCAPLDPERYHGKEELCDGIDNDCIGGVPANEVDGDGDGVLGCDGDCNDANNQVYPGAVESCLTGYDDDCDGDDNTEDAAACTNYFKDEDGDTYGTDEAKCLCYPEAPYTAGNSLDCDDTNDAIRPNAMEDCDTQADDNCDGSLTAVGALNCELFYKDGDKDGFGVAESQCACEPNGIFTADNVLDCNDGTAAINPDATEDCLTIGVDDNCNGTANDMDADNCFDWYEDKDGDTFGTGQAVCICEPQSVYTSPNADDCDDANGLIFPGKKELCSTPYDDNCNEETNEADADGCTPWWVDQDGDGFAGTQICYCEAPANAEDFPEDCCDADPDAFPGQTKFFSDEVNWCGGYDYNCDNSDEKQYGSSCVEEPCTAGWFQPNPACGKTGNWCLNCNGCGSCIGQTIQQAQKCR